MSQDEPTGTSTTTISASTTPASPYWVVSGHQRDPHLFAGLRGEDVEDWLDDYDRVSSANRWDDASKLRHVAFYLTGVAKTWFFNHEVDFTNWGAFKQQLRQIFGTPAVRSALAKKTLDTRKQQPGESYTSYIEDVLALCRRVNTAMTESDRVRHILKGIGAIAFNALAIQNPATVADIVATCQRLDELESVRLQPDTTANTSADDPTLRAMIRAIIREELQYLGLAAGPMPSHASDTNLRDVIKEELASMAGAAYTDPLTPRAPSTYAQVAAATPVIVPPMPPKPTPAHIASMTTSAPTQTSYPQWRPPRPICYYCGYRGHIARFCRKRQQDERRGYDTLITKS
ncbi:uncharacterized protein [Dermacentor andersoni]|uniref:uncharacterized protein n=1 Tax=Dermacentor andersoni TaxID=34620 RepID=UPI003B3AEAEF